MTFFSSPIQFISGDHDDDDVHDHHAHGDGDGDGDGQLEWLIQDGWLILTVDFRWMAYCSPGNPVIPEQEAGSHLLLIIFIFSLENHELSIFLPLLKIGVQHLKFLFFFSKTEKLFPLSLLLLEAWEQKIHFSFSSRKLRIFFFLSKLVKGISGFSFLSRNWRKESWISLSLLDWTFWPLVNGWCQLLDLS